jgi:hypothetical protein
MASCVARRPPANEEPAGSAGSHKLLLIWRARARDYHYFGRFLLLTSVMGLNEAADAAVKERSQ